MTWPTTVISLGDSVSCGEGVGVNVPLAQTWVGILASALDAHLMPLAVPGCRVRDVRAGQLPRAVTAAPALATVLIGLNDVVRAGFDLDAFTDDLATVVHALSAAGHTVLLGRLHNPTAVLPLPGGLRRHVEARVASINAAVEAIAIHATTSIHASTSIHATTASDPPVIVFDLDAIDALRARAAFGVDRMHPGPSGHQSIAAAAGATLAAHRLAPTDLIPAPAPVGAPGRIAEGRWLVRHGTPWLAGHLRQVALPLAGMLVGRSAETSA